MGYLVCSTYLHASFMHVGPISMLTNRPCHGPWTVNESWRFHSVSHSQSPSQMWSPEYWAENMGIDSLKLQSGILLHKCIHINGQYSFWAMILPSICVAILIFTLCIIHPDTEESDGNKETSFWWTRRELDGCYYRCHLINIVLLSVIEILFSC